MTMERVKRTGLLAGVTAAETFFAVVLGGELVSFDLSVAEAAAVAGLGAGLSVVYNSLREWRQRLGG
jgi:hypothetical protein